MKDARREILERLYEVAYDHGYCKIIQQIEDTANVTLAELDKLEGKEYWTKGEYSKLDDTTKEIDRYTVRAILTKLKSMGYVHESEVFVTVEQIEAAGYVKQEGNTDLNKMTEL